jgi:hypothetical protein
VQAVAVPGQPQAVLQSVVPAYHMLPVWTQTSSGEWVPQYRVWWVDTKTAAGSSATATAAPATPAAVPGLLIPAVADTEGVVSPAAVSQCQQRNNTRADQQHSHVSPPYAHPVSATRAAAHSRNTGAAAHSRNTGAAAHSRNTGAAAHSRNSSSNNGGGSSSRCSAAVAALVNGMGTMALSGSSSSQAHAAALTKRSSDDTSSQLKRDQVRLTRDCSLTSF